jgi:glycosyltransferase involved in cell wall biosynthesis
MARVFLSVRERLNADLWLIGDGAEMGPVRTIFRQNAAHNHVKYWGLQSDIPRLLAQTDLLLVTSETESFCLAALEAMACGVPVLAPRVGGLPEVVLDGKTGILFEVDDYDSAADAAVDLLSDPNRLRAMREAAIQHASGFSHQEGVDRYEALYHRLIGARTNGRMDARSLAAPSFSPSFGLSAGAASEE